MRACAALAVGPGARALLCAAILGGVPGCGAMINGTVREVTVRSTTPGAEVYVNGGLAGKAPATFRTGNAAEQTVTVHAPGYEDKDVVLAPKVKPVPIVLDILCSLTIVGVAAPISDGMLGTFVALEPKEMDVALEPARAVGPTPVRQLSYSPGDIRVAAVAPTTAAPAAPPPAPAQQPAKGKGGAKARP